MQKELATIRQHSDPAHEGFLQKFETDLFEEAAHLGKHDGLQNRPCTDAELHAYALNKIQALVQGAINRNQHIFLPISGMVITTGIRTHAAEKVRAIATAKGDDERTVRKLQSELVQLTPDLAKMKARKFVLSIEAFVAITEGCMSYDGFRHGNLSTMAAACASVGLTIGVGAGAHVFSGYIARSENRKQLIRRFSTVFIPYAVCLTGIAALRARAYTHMSLLNPNQVQVLQGDTASLIFIIALLSVGLFAFVLCLAIKYYRSDNERQLEQAYKDKCGEIEKMSAEVAAKKAEIAAIENEAKRESDMALSNYEYAFGCEKRLISDADKAAEEYKGSNLRHRTDNHCPPCYCDTTKLKFNFIKFFDNAKTDNHETDVDNKDGN